MPTTNVKRMRDIRPGDTIVVESVPRKILAVGWAKGGLFRIEWSSGYFSAHQKLKMEVSSEPATD